MKKVLILGMLIIACSYQSIFAFKVGVAVPINATLEDANESSTVNVSGYSLELELPFSLGFGVDSWEYQIGSENEITNQQLLYNIFYSLPVPVLVIDLGVGFGKSDVSTKSNQTDSANTTQYYAKIGYAIVPLFSLNFGYHVVNVDEIKLSNTKHNFSANVISFGAQLGF